MSVRASGLASFRRWMTGPLGSGVSGIERRIIGVTAKDGERTGDNSNRPFGTFSVTGER